MNAGPATTIARDVLDLPTFKEEIYTTIRASLENRLKQMTLPEYIEHYQSALHTTHIVMTIHKNFQ
jgi:hypothetical protein